MVGHFRGMNTPPVPVSAVHQGTVRKGRDGYWWIARNTWEPLGDHTTPNGLPAKKRKTRKAGKASVAWAAKTGMIKVFFSRSESCNSKRTCRIPEVDLGTWRFQQLLMPYSPKHKYQYIYEYSGPLEAMEAARKKLETQFRGLKRRHLVTEFEMQANSMLEKYKGWSML